MIHYAETPYGFDYGAAKVSRVCSDKERGWVVIAVHSQKSCVHVYVTKTGKMKVEVVR